MTHNQFEEIRTKKRLLRDAIKSYLDAEFEIPEELLREYNALIGGTIDKVFIGRELNYDTTRI